MTIVPATDRRGEEPLHGHYLIAYLVRQQQIDILGIFHAALDIGRLLGPSE